MMTAKGRPQLLCEYSQDISQTGLTTCQLIACEYPIRKVLPRLWWSSN